MLNPSGLRPSGAKTRFVCSRHAEPIGSETLGGEDSFWDLNVCHAELRLNRRNLDSASRDPEMNSG